MRRFVLGVSFSVILTACGGGGGGGGSTPLAAPSGLSYTTPVKATAGQALSGVTPTVTGTVSTWSVSPALPAGLSICPASGNSNCTSGEVYGTPTALSSQANYTITAGNASGSTTFSLALSVLPAAPSGFGYQDSKMNAVTSAGVVLTVGKAMDPIRPVITGTVDSYSLPPNGALPAGLFLDTASGTVSGTPKAVQTIKVYTISATNAGGTATFSLNITINPPPTTATGIFRTRVQGMSYSSGTESGITDGSGQFTYVVGSTVTFKVGNVTLGTANGGPLLFPVDLVAGGTGTNRAVINIDRFLQMLDHDGNVANGIVIAPAVQTAAAGWGAVNFDQDANSFAAAVASIITDVNTADPGITHSLPAASDSTAHVKKTFQCAYAGGFIGEYKGTTASDDHGRFGATVKPDGTIEVFGNTLATPPGVGFDSLDSNAVQVDQARSITINDPDPPFPLAGNFLSPDTMEGTWNNNTPPTQSGTFTGTRLGPSFDVLASDPTTRHFSGNIELRNDPNEVATGIVVMDVGASGAVSGFVYHFSDGRLDTIAGTLDTTSNAFTGTVGDVAATATLYPAGTPEPGISDNHPNADWLDGGYTPAGGATVSFITDGCSLE